MARRTFNVVDIIEILVHWHAGRSKSEIAQSLGVDRKAAGKYITAAQAAGMVPGGPVACQNSCRASDLGFSPRHSCSFASSICSGSGCSAGWRSSPAAMFPRTRRRPVTRTGAFDMTVP